MILTAEISSRNSHPQNNANPVPDGLFAVPIRAPFAEPVVIPGNDPTTTNEVITHTEAVEQRSPEFPVVESSSSSSSAASDQQVILEPTVYVPPTRPSVILELEDAIAQSPPEAAEDRSRPSSSSSSSSSSG